MSRSLRDALTTSALSVLLVTMIAGCANDGNVLPDGPIGPVNSLTSGQVCLGHAGGPKPTRPVNRCYPVAPDAHIGRDVHLGSYVELRLRAGAAEWIDVYKGLKPV